MPSTRFGGRASCWWISAASSVRVLLPRDYPQRAEENLDVHREAPCTDVLVVELDTSFHFVEGVGLAAETHDLGQPRDPRLYLMA